MSARVTNREQSGSSVAGDMSYDYLITGIPRSGTSLVCRLLDDQPNSVVINEPREAIVAVNEPSYHAFLLQFHADLRAKILAGTPVRNKVTQGRVRCDTLGANASEFYVPRVESAAFLLGTKDTLQYLSRLDTFRHALGDMRGLVCIRHPVSTIDSWKRSFPHLATADVRALRSLKVLGSSSARDVREIAAIGRVKDVRARRARFWRFLASIVSRNRDWVTVIRYEDLVANTRRVLAGVLAMLDPVRARQDISVEVSIEPKRSLSVLDAAEARLIWDICRDEALLHGYGSEPQMPGDAR